MKPLLAVLVASALAASSTVALALPAGELPANSNTEATQQRSGAFADRERALQDESRSSASGAVSVEGSQSVERRPRSTDRARDFAEQERVLTRESRSSASGHHESAKTPKLTVEERRAIERDAEAARASQSQP